VYNSETGQTITTDASLKHSEASMAQALTWFTLPRETAAPDPHGITVVTDEDALVTRARSEHDQIKTK